MMGDAAGRAAGRAGGAPDGQGRQDGGDGGPTKWDVEVNRGIRAGRAEAGLRVTGAEGMGRRVRMQEGGREVAGEIERVWGVQGVGSWKGVGCRRGQNGMESEQVTGWRERSGCGRRGMGTGSGMETERGGREKRGSRYLGFHVPRCAPTPIFPVSELTYLQGLRSGPGAARALRCRRCHYPRVPCSASRRRIRAETGPGASPGAARPRHLACARPRHSPRAPSGDRDAGGGGRDAPARPRPAHQEWFAAPGPGKALSLRTHPRPPCAPA